MTILAHVADRFLGVPLMLTPEKAEIVLQVLDGRIAFSALDREGLAPVPEGNAFATRRVADSQMARMTDSGIAVLPIIGSLVHRGAWLGASSGLVSYEGLTAQLTALANDSSVKGILLDINSPGGEATSGAFDVPRLIREIRDSKPVFAVANDMICSAAYAIASASSQIFVNDLSITGSIGVIMVHLDRSAEMTIKGVKPTIIRSDGDKALGNSLEPLSQEAFGLFKAEVDRIKTTFVQTVVAGRGKQMSEGQVRALGAGVFHGRDAIAKGLADREGGFFDALAAIEAAVTSTSSRSPGSARRMDDATQVTASEETSTTETTMSTPAPAPASDAPAANEAATTDAAAQAAAAASARIAAILDAPEAKGREDLARHLAFKTQTPASDAVGLLAAAPQGRSGPDPIIGAGVTQSGAPAADITGAAKGRAIGERVKQMRGFAKAAL